MPLMHLSLRASDLDASSAFYTALFGAGPDKKRDDYARFTVADPPLVLSLVADPTAKDQVRGPVDHVGLRFTAPDALTAAVERLRVLGLAQDVETGVSCCYAVKDEVWLHDPDGVAWEIYTVTGESASLLPSNTCCAPDASLPQVEPAVPAATGCCG